ncbi:transcriptional regulator [Halocalculus aciditolerans]|uniref:Transcriptional regulator n=1 Tax=Halocalculus aciditolerans TaxID=1383812 RepID=A0A830FCY4_9EURY|nr:transcriptional regulator [Halocalculus aciditolerans]GGL63237.1 transcriptional regulator [Halocalculus aciditolerans]
MEARTTRQRIADALREEPGTPSSLAAAFELTPHAALTHVEHIAKSLDAQEEELLVRPPACRECGFDGFDDPLNLPSRCPECKHEGIEEPAFVIERRGST